MAKRIGEYRYRAELQAPTTTLSDAGDPQQAYTTYATVWASLDALDGTEADQADGITATTGYTVGLRYNSVIKPKDQILIQGLALGVVSVTSDKFLRQTIVKAKINGG